MSIFALATRLSASLRIFINKHAALLVVIVVPVLELNLTAALTTQTQACGARDLDFARHKYDAGKDVFLQYRPENGRAGTYARQTHLEDREEDRIRSIPGRVEDGQDSVALPDRYDEAPGGKDVNSTVNIS